MLSLMGSSDKKRCPGRFGQRSISRFFVLGSGCRCDCWSGEIFRAGVSLPIGSDIFDRTGAGTVRVVLGIDGPFVGLSFRPGYLRTLDDFAGRFGESGVDLAFATLGSGNGRVFGVARGVLGGRGIQRADTAFGSGDVAGSGGTGIRFCLGQVKGTRFAIEAGSCSVDLVGIGSGLGNRSRARGGLAVCQGCGGAERAAFSGFVPGRIAGMISRLTVLVGPRCGAFLGTGAPRRARVERTGASIAVLIGAGTRAGSCVAGGGSRRD